MNHKVYKVLPYFSRKFDYWKEVSNDDNLVRSRLGGFFGMNLFERLMDGHYNIFDDRGLPLRFNAGKPYYSYSTVFSFALANHQMYIRTGDESYLKPLFETVRFISTHGKYTSSGGWGFPHHGVHSAMNQGEALSILARAYEVDGKDEYLDKVEDILRLYEIDIQNEGVLGMIRKQGGIEWYEELAELPGKHILNGMNYALLGLYEIAQICPEFTKASVLFDKGIDSLVKALEFFDNGFWSEYWIHDSENNYIASVMYHNLHIVQLRFLSRIANNSILNDYATIFDKYNSKISCRLRAGYEMSISKLGL